ncbi:MAG: hypothetical protein HXS44_01220 [Theionarchaea archaeon]|nr:hypothetical protein [Theionarchaea archaeon]
MSESSPLSALATDSVIKEIEENGRYILRPRVITHVIYFMISFLIMTAALEEALFYGGLFYWLVAGFFGLAVFSSGCDIFSIGSYLLLNQEGFTVNTLFRSYTIKWTEFKYFTIICGYLHVDIVIGYSKSQKIDLWPPWEQEQESS